MWVNVSIRDSDGSFLGITGGGVEAREFSRALHSYGELPGINMFLARRDGQLVYASDRSLLREPGHIDNVSAVQITEQVDGTEGIAGRCFMPDGPTGSLLWARYSEPWDTFIAIEKTGDTIDEREVSLIRRNGGQSCLVMLDLDRFKDVNDAHGHPTGDAALRAVAGLIRSQLRETDIAARFGGEEFAVLLPNTSIDGATQLAERIRAAVEGGPVSSAGQPPLPQLTISIGVTSLMHDDIGPDEAYHRADDALYRAKRNGRNRAECVV